MPGQLIGCLEFLCLTALAITPAAGQQAAFLALKTAGRGSSSRPMVGHRHFFATKDIVIQVEVVLVSDNREAGVRR